MRRKRQEILVGAVALIAFAILVVMTINLKRLLFFVRMYDIKVRFKKASGLEVGANVYVYGVLSGEVKRIEYVSGECPVLVILSMKEKVQIYKNANIHIVTAGLIGETKIEVEAGTPDFPLVEDGDMLTGADMVDLYQTMSLAPQIIEDASVTIHTIRGFMSEEKNQRAVRETVQRVGSLSVSLDDLLTTTSADIKQIASSLSEASIKIDQLLGDLQSSVEELHSAVQESTRNLNLSLKTMTDKVAETTGNINNTSHAVEDTAQAISDTARSIEKTSTNLSELMQDEREAIQKSIDELARSSEHIQNILEKVDTGSGTVGKLIKDPSVFYELRDSLRELRKVLQGFNQAYTRDQINYEQPEPETTEKTE
jgi:phospholipid/cholesterol/gamma-HCH transport system substrate-binding protein